MQQDPQSAAQFAQARALFRQRRFAEAAALAGQVARDHPGRSGFAAFAAEAAQASGDLPSALAWIDKAIEAGNDPQHLVKKAWLLSEALRRDEIPALVEEIARRAGGEDGGLLFWQLAKLCQLHNRLPQAVGYYRRALQAGERPDWLYDLATACFHLGETEAAEQGLDRLLELDPGAGPAIYQRSVLRRQTLQRNHIADIRGRLKTGFRKQENRAAALYALAKELEDVGEHAESFDALEEGAKTRRGIIRYDVSAATAGLQEIQDHVDADALAAIPDGHGGEGAIFIVGMPRTGTTLAQRLLLQSQAVRDAGELMDFNHLLTAAIGRVREATPSLSPSMASLRVDFAELGRRYMLGARQMAAGSRWFIDKMPVNYMYCGLIHKALPNARIIHLVRDPLDTCYAIFKTLFFSAYEFSYDQKELAEYYIGYHRLMRHWHDVMPGRILDISYEELVTDSEAQARRIYDWCGLEWTPVALEAPGVGAAFATASAAQVRGPIHARSVHSSRRHIDRLQPLLTRLAAAGVPTPSSASALAAETN